MDNFGLTACRHCVHVCGYLRDFKTVGLDISLVVAVPNFLWRLCELLTDLRNTFYEFGTFTAHSISILSELKMYTARARRSALHRQYQLHSVEGHAKVQQFLNIVNSWLVHVLLDKAVN